jgi:hypothetical protein
MVPVFGTLAILFVGLTVSKVGSKWFPASKSSTL